MKVSEPEIIDVLLGGADPELEGRVHCALRLDPEAAARHADWAAHVAFLHHELAPIRQLSLRVRGGVAERLRAQRDASGLLLPTAEDALLAAAYLASLRRRRFGYAVAACAAALFGFILVHNLPLRIGSGRPIPDALLLGDKIETVEEGRRAAGRRAPAETLKYSYELAALPPGVVGQNIANTSAQVAMVSLYEHDALGRSERDLMASNSASGRFLAYPAQGGTTHSRAVALDLPTRAATLGAQPTLILNSGMASSSPAADLAQERASHPTRLVRRGPAPQAYKKETPPPGVREIQYASGELRLMAWLSDIPAGGLPRPAVVYVHGGFAFERADWEAAAAFAGAGFVVLAPTLRGENGNPGAFEAYYGEVDDVIAAGRHLAGQTGVDPGRVYVAGHSVGGVLAMLAAMVPSPYRGAAAIGGAPDPGLLFHGNWRSEAPFDPADPLERRLRTPRAFAAAVRCPLLLVVAQDDRELLAQTQLMVGEARQAGRPVELALTPGDHRTSLQQGIQRSIQSFQ